MACMYVKLGVPLILFIILTLFIEIVYTFQFQLGSRPPPGGVASGVCLWKLWYKPKNYQCIAD